eukprot:TRINITY_DN4328_c0_g1_i1.p1 TRINITY_DN4328_c0_g1~~TRINITY_DN4328_c0_g1_i1.p1  ORF type:complete len:631 (+),score=193.04 TRINITY_DN4328_c0_g1_i1:57-1895(+)
MARPRVAAALLASAVLTGGIAVPSPEQLAWAADEIGVLVTFNMATSAGSQGCGPGNPPPPSTFNPTKLNTDQWVEAMQALGAKYAVYVAKHGCGFTAWPTNVSLPFLPGPGGSYGYSVKEAVVKTDVAGSFAASCRAKGIKPGFYYSLGSNAYAKQQLKLSDEQYDQLVVAQVRELWSSYGQLDEIWFDGGYQQSIKQNLTDLLATLQPKAIVFQGYGVANSSVRWVGTESGNAPYPNWSPNQGGTAGGGQYDGPDWVPGESDTTLQENDQWFYRKDYPIRSLKELQDVYHGTVGRNTNLLLDMAPTPDGVVDDKAMQRYKEFGDWIRQCYGPGQEINQTGPGGGGSYRLELHNATHPGAGVAVDRVVIQEDQTRGETILSYVVQALTPAGWVAVAAGKSVGNKRIHIFEQGTITTQHLLMNVTSTGPIYLKNFAAYGPYACGGSPPPQPHNCAVAGPGQLGAFRPCTYGAHQKWSMLPAAGGKVTLQLQGLSAAAEQDLCLTVTALAQQPPAAALNGGAYTNATVLRTCDGSAAQLWSYSPLKQLTHTVGGVEGCLDCADCQKADSKAWVYTPCYGGGKGSPNEEFNYEAGVATLVDGGFGKCLGVCGAVR